MVSHDLDQEKTVAIFIGTSRCANKNSGIEMIPEVENNIEEFKKIVLNKKIIGISEKNITVILNEDETTILKSLVDVLRKPWDTVIIYYAGHGFISSYSSKLLLATKESILNKIDYTTLSLDRLQQTILHECKAPKKIFILDSCFSGRAINIMSDKRSLLRETIKKDGVFTLASAPSNSPAISSIENSCLTAFTHLLLEALNEGIENHQSVITIQELYDYIRNQALSRNLPEPQCNNIQNANKIIIAYNRKPIPSELTIVKKELFKTIRSVFKYLTGRNYDEVSEKDLFQAIAITIQRNLLDNLLSFKKKTDAKKIYILSKEVPLGRLILKNLLNLKKFQLYEEALRLEGFNIDNISILDSDNTNDNPNYSILECILDSLTTFGIDCEIHTINYNIRGYSQGYNYRNYSQDKSNHDQYLTPDNHDSFKNSPWTLKKDEKIMIPIYGEIVEGEDQDGNYNPMWVNWLLYIGTTINVFITGSGSKLINHLTLFKSKTSDEFDLNQFFIKNDFSKSFKDELGPLLISKAPFYDTSSDITKELKFTQDFFLVMCSITNICRQYKVLNDDWSSFSKKIVIHIPDSSLALAIPEFVRVLVDIEGLSWDESWEITKKSFSYDRKDNKKNSVMKWPAPLVSKIAPRHFQIIEEIDKRFRLEMEAQSFEIPMIIEEGESKNINFDTLAIITSFSVNSDGEQIQFIDKDCTVAKFQNLWPKKFFNISIGPNHRLWMLNSNSKLSNLISEFIGDGWKENYYKISELEKYSKDDQLLKAFQQMKLDCKKELVNSIRERLSMLIDPFSFISLQYGEFSEYNRQLLNIMNIVYTFFLIK